MGVTLRPSALHQGLKSEGAEEERAGNVTEITFTAAETPLAPGVPSAGRALATLIQSLNPAQTPRTREPSLRALSTGGHHGGKSEKGPTPWTLTQRPLLSLSLGRNPEYATRTLPWSHFNLHGTKSQCLEVTVLFCLPEFSPLAYRLPKGTEVFLSQTFPG